MKTEPPNLLTQTIQSAVNSMLYLYVFVIPFFSFSRQQPYHFEHLTVADGLSHNKVQCILQDKQGYMWFGTIYGLNRYDGYNFRKFENIPGDTLTPGNNNVVSLYQDSDEIIWIGTSTMLSSYNPAKETFHNYHLPAL